MEDLKFDKLIGKAGPNEDSSGELRPLSEADINMGGDFLLPVMTKK
jgi:hypothetical protein